MRNTGDIPLLTKTQVGQQVGYGYAVMFGMV